MIQFLEIELSNFAIYPRALFRFSTDPSKPLTLIRGENASGKTTLMRAFLWVLFGKEGLQSPGTMASALRPVWAPTGEPVATRVRLAFQQVQGNRSVRFNLVRRTTTTGRGNGDIGEETVTLARQDADGQFKPQTEAAVEVLHGIIRPEMRDFYFIDADKAVDYIGGSEGNHDDQLMRRMIGKSIRGLLALDALLKATSRIDFHRNNYHREIAAAKKGSDGENHEGELIRIEAAIKDVQDQLPRAQEEHSKAINEHRVADGRFSAMIAEFERSTKSASELKALRDKRDQLNVQRRQLLHQLSEAAPGTPLAAALISKSIKEILQRLEPMKEKGHIPPHELEVIPRLIDRGVCLCGSQILEDSIERKTLEATLDRARQTETGARFLDGVLGLAAKHRREANSAIRSDVVGGLRRDLSVLDPQVAELSGAIESLESKIQAQSGREAEALEMKKDVSEKLNRRDSCRDTVQRLEDQLKRLQDDLRSAQGRSRAAAGRSAQTRTLQACVRAADVVHSVLNETYHHIERAQVDEVSKCMDILYKSITGEGDEGLVSSVGLRPIGRVESLPEYELFAKLGDADKSLQLINGASRRALSVAFVLALAEQTGSRVPLVSDSLLHSTSGAVRERLVRFLVSGNHVGQPIMFGTRDDFHSSEVRALLSAHAGEYYTLTAQSHVGGDVVRPDPNREQPHQVSVCRCGHEEYCAICERKGDADRSDLRRAAS